MLHLEEVVSGHGLNDLKLSVILDSLVQVIAGHFSGCNRVIHVLIGAFPALDACGCWLPDGVTLFADLWCL